MSLFLVVPLAYVATGLVCSAALFCASWRSSDDETGLGLGIGALLAPMVWPALVGVLLPIAVRGCWGRRTRRRTH